MAPPHRLLQDALLAAVAVWSDRTAIVPGGARLSYREVGNHACRLVHALLALGVTCGVRVVIFMDKGW